MGEARWKFEGNLGRIISILSDGELVLIKKMKPTCLKNYPEKHGNYIIEARPCHQLFLIARNENIEQDKLIILSDTTIFDSDKIEQEFNKSTQWTTSNKIPIEIKKNEFEHLSPTAKITLQENGISKNIFKETLPTQIKEQNSPIKTIELTDESISQHIKTNEKTTNIPTNNTENKIKKTYTRYGREIKIPKKLLEQ